MTEDLLRTSLRTSEVPLARPSRGPEGPLRRGFTEDRPLGDLVLEDLRSTITYTTYVVRVYIRGPIGPTLSPDPGSSWILP